MNQDETFAEIPDDEMRQYEDEFNEFLAELLEYSKEMGVPVSYVEDEFVIEGVLHKVQLPTETHL